MRIWLQTSWVLLNIVIQRATERRRPTRSERAEQLPTVRIHSLHTIPAEARLHQRTAASCSPIGQLLNTWQRVRERHGKIVTLKSLFMKEGRRVVGVGGGHTSVEVWRNKSEGKTQRLPAKKPAAAPPAIAEEGGNE